MRKNIVLLAGLMAAVSAAPALALDYELVSSWAQINTLSGGGSSQFWGAEVDGHTLYCNLGSDARIVKVDNLNGVQTSTELVSAAAWRAYTGATTTNTFLSANYGFSIKGNNIQISDASTDNIVHVNKYNGTISTYVSKAAIKTAAGLTTTEPSLGSFYGQALDGEVLFWEGTSNSIMKTTGPGSAVVAVTAAEVTALAAPSAPAVSSGIEVDADGAIYFGMSVTDKIYRKNTGGTIDTLITGADLQPLIGTNQITFRDILYGGDGLMYFFDSGTDNVLRFDPAAATPASTLEIFLSKADFVTNGIAGGDDMWQMNWYRNSLSFSFHESTGGKGYFRVVPEPASMLLLALGGLGLLRRRRA